MISNGNIDIHCVILYINVILMEVAKHMLKLQLHSRHLNVRSSNKICFYIH